MNGISCDACGTALLVDESARYEVRIDVRAAYDPLELTREDVDRDHRAEIDALIAQLARLDPVEAADQVHQAFRFDLCCGCQRQYLRLLRRPGLPLASA